MIRAVLVAYVSGHGYGHATRVGQVLRAVRRREPAKPLAVVTSAPRDLYTAAVEGPLLYRPLECDVGLVQKGALLIDEEATEARCRAFAERWPARVEGEAEWLRRVGASVVLGDVPPLAFAAAAAAGLPSLGLANFSWDWIYQAMAGRRPGLGEAAAAAARAYSTCRLLLELPFAGDLSAFPRRRRIPLVARRPGLAREEARRRLALGPGPVVLVSFGGLGLPGFSPGVLERLDGFTFVLPEGREAPSNARVLDRERLAAAGLRYEDLVGAADVVLTKPGYGIVSDAIGAGTRIVYTERGDFAEYPILVAEMSRMIPCAHVSNGDLMAGRLEEPLRDVLERPIPAPPDLGGAGVAAEALLGTNGRPRTGSG